MADLGPGTMPRGKYPESPAPAGSHALISRTPTPGGMLHANLGLPRPPPRNFQPPLPQQPPKQTQQRRHNVPPVQSLRDSAAATPVGCAAWRRRFRIFSFRYREMMSGMTMGGFFHMLGAWERHRGGGALLPFVLGAVAGACVGRWTGQPRMPPRERLHEGNQNPSYCRSTGDTQCVDAPASSACLRNPAQMSGIAADLRGV